MPTVTRLAILVAASSILTKSIRTYRNGKLGLVGGPLSGAYSLGASISVSHKDRDTVSKSATILGYVKRGVHR
jgi:hypothetical protein